MGSTYTWPEDRKFKFVEPLLLVRMGKPAQGVDESDAFAVANLEITKTSNDRRPISIRRIGVPDRPPLIELVNLTPIETRTADASERLDSWGDDDGAYLLATMEYACMIGATHVWTGRVTTDGGQVSENSDRYAVYFTKSGIDMSRPS